MEELLTGMASIAIVGGAGFIGGRLGAVLRRAGHTVKVVDVVAASDPDVEWRGADVRDYEALTRALAGSEVVYNLAAVHRDDVKPLTRYEEVNVTGAVNVCSVCREVGRRAAHLHKLGGRVRIRASQHRRRIGAPRHPTPMDAPNSSPSMCIASGRPKNPRAGHWSWYALPWFSVKGIVATSTNSSVRSRRDVS